MTRIGGTLDLDSLRALYGSDAGAREHASRTSDEIRVAIHDMRARGLGDHQIAELTLLHVDQVRALIADARR